MVFEKMRKIADLSIDKVHCCCFDEGNVKEDLKITNYNRSIETDMYIYIYESRSKV